MKKRPALIILVAVLIIALALNYYTIPVKESADSEIIKIGFIAPLSGPGAGTGISAKQGFELANEQFPNINGKKIKVIFEDDKADSATGLSAAKKLVEVDSLKIIVSAFSGPTLAIASYANEKGFSLSSPVAASPKLSGIGKNFFRISSSSVDMATKTAEVAYSKGFRKIAVMYELNDYPIGWKDSFKQSFESLGGEIIAVEQFGSKDTDVKAQLVRLNDTNADAILILTLAAPTGIISLKQSKELGITKQIIGNESFAFRPVLVLGEISDGTIVSQYAYDDNSDLMKKFLADYRAKFTSGDSELYAALGYDNYMLLRDAIGVCAGDSPSGLQALGGEQAECITAYVKGIGEVNGVSGKYKINALGDAKRAIKLTIIENGLNVDYN